MDAHRFDALTRSLVASGSRRRLLALAAGTLGLAGPAAVIAHHRHHHHRRGDTNRCLGVDCFNPCLSCNPRTGECEPVTTCGQDLPDCCPVQHGSVLVATCTDVRYDPRNCNGCGQACDIERGEMCAETPAQQTPHCCQYIGGACGGDGDCCVGFCTPDHECVCRWPGEACQQDDNFNCACCNNACVNGVCLQSARSQPCRPGTSDCESHNGPCLASGFCGCVPLGQPCATDGECCFAGTACFDALGTGQKVCWYTSP
jgi:hypothetical protein